jgi:hypothetical protein
MYVNINGAETFPDDPVNPVPIRIEINTDAQQPGRGRGCSSAHPGESDQAGPPIFHEAPGIPARAGQRGGDGGEHQDLDIVLTFDESGSMEFDTLCYGCWTPDDTVEYPEGNRYPLVWNGPYYGPPQHCQGNAIPTLRNNTLINPYIAIEAEEYSYLSNDYHRATSAGQGYTAWAMQRNGTIYDPKTGYLGDSGAWGRDTQGAYLISTSVTQAMKVPRRASGVRVYLGRSYQRGDVPAQRLDNQSRRSV